MTDILIKAFIKNPDDTKDKAVRERYGTLGSAVGIICNILLSLIKISIGVLAGSISIIADGLNNLSDMGSSVITMLGFKLAGRPADRDHPFGHGRIEYISAFAVALLILLVGFELLTSSIETLIGGDRAPKYGIWAIVALIVSVVIKLWMYLFNRKLAKKINSSALAATAQDCINDVIATAAILVAVIISSLIALPFNLDAVMAAGVALFILWSGVTAAKDTLDEILGRAPDPELIKELEREIMSFEGFLGIHDLIVHNYGPGRQFASVHVEVPQDTDIVKCHEQIDLCEKYVVEKTGVALVIHMDPIDINNERIQTAKASMQRIISEIDERLTLHDFRMTPSAERINNLIFDVVVPAKFDMANDELNALICRKARETNDTYCCVITFDNDFTGK